MGCISKNAKEIFVKISKFWWMTGASAVGIAASFWQLLEKLALLKNHDIVLSCNLNSVFSILQLILIFYSLMR